MSEQNNKSRVVYDEVFFFSSLCFPDLFQECLCLLGAVRAQRGILVFAKNLKESQMNICSTTRKGIGVLYTLKRTNDDLLKERALKSRHTFSSA